MSCGKMTVGRIEFNPGVVGTVERPLPDNYETRPRPMSLDEYQRKAERTAVFPMNFGLAYTALAMMGEAGEYADKILRLGDRATHPGAVFNDPAMAALTAAAEEAAGCEAWKKAIRKKLETTIEIPIPTGEDRDGLLKELGDQLWYIAIAAKLLGASLEDVANINLHKLADRKSRGVIKGEGDNR